MPTFKHLQMSMKNIFLNADNKNPKYLVGNRFLFVTEFIFVSNNYNIAKAIRCSFNNRTGRACNYSNYYLSAVKKGVNNNCSRQIQF
jgi:hypothetical protein